MVHLPLTMLAVHNAGPNLLKVSELAFVQDVLLPQLRSGPRAKAFKCVGKKNPGANQAQ
jgi:hypothetical protein